MDGILCHAQPQPAHLSLDFCSGKEAEMVLGLILLMIIVMYVPEEAGVSCPRRMCTYLSLLILEGPG